MLQGWKKWAAIVLLAAAAGGGYYWYSTSQSATGTPTYTTGKVGRGSISVLISSTGTINPVNYVDVSTNVAGTLEHVYVKENDVVTTGQLIASIDQRQLQAVADDASATLENKRLNLSRYETLAAQGAIATQTYDTALMEYRTALAAYERAAANLSDALITAPMDGTIIGTPLKSGQTISTGISTQMIIATIADLSHLEIYLTVDETDIGNVHAGSKVDFTVDAYPGKTYTGTVSDISKGTKGNMGATSSSVVYYTVKVSIPTEQSGELFPTMTARATIYGDEQKDALTVPLTAIRTDKVGEYVYLIKNGTPKRTSVTTGITGESDIQIVSGVSEGDEIVVSGDITASTKTSTGGGGPMF